MKPKNPSGCPDEFRGKRGPAKSLRTIEAKRAGISRHQMHQAIAIANIPDDEFERLIEQDRPPSLTALASTGKKSKGTGSTPYSRLVTAWNAASESDRQRLLEAAGAGVRLAKPEGDA